MWSWIPQSLIFATCLTVALLSRAHSKDEFFRKLGSDFLQVLENKSNAEAENLGNYPWLFRIFQADVLKWNPTGRPDRHIPNCDPRRFQDMSLGPEISPRQLPQQIEGILQECHREWETGRDSFLVNSVGMMLFQLHPTRHPFGRQILLHLPNHIKIKGFLAMKPDGKKRPLVIFRTGLFSNTHEFYPERSLFLQMFEQSPFHVLVLESSTGSEFLKNNTSWAVGGFDEGIQNFLIARQLQTQQEPISKWISHVHLMGSSMGGHGALFGALLNEHNLGPQGQRVLQSSLAFCPLINMQETLEFHQRRSPFIGLMNYWASRRLQVLKVHIPEISEENFIPQFFDWIQDTYKGPLVAAEGRLPDLNLPPGMQSVLLSPQRPADLFWQMNHFWPWYQNVQTPVMVFSTRQDPVVEWTLNSGRIAEKQLQTGNSNFHLVTFEKGHHCSLPIAYEWEALSTLFQTFILKNSPGFQLRPVEFRLPLASELRNQFGDRAPLLDLSFDVEPGSTLLFAKVRFDREFWPSFQERWKAPWATARLPLKDLEFPFDSEIHSEDEASLLLRWAYQNIRVRLDGEDLVFYWKVTQ
jgi:hypothetical protein